MTEMTEMTEKKGSRPPLNVAAALFVDGFFPPFLMIH